MGPLVFLTVGTTDGEAPAKRKGLADGLYRHREQIEYGAPKVKVIRNENGHCLYLSHAQKEQSWEVIRLKARGEHLCTVAAADEEAALKIAVKRFELDAADVKRLLVRKA